MHNHQKEYFNTFGYTPLTDIIFVSLTYYSSVFIPSTTTLYLLNAKATMIGQHCIAVELTILSDVIIVTCQECFS